MIADFMALTATILTAVFLIPQIIHLVRRGDRTGVSVAWAAFGVVTNSAWVVYLGVLGLWAAIVAPCLAVVTYGITLSVLAPMDRRRTWMWSSGLYAVVFAATGPLGGTGTLGLALAIAPAFQVTPAIVAVFRERCPTGVSPATWSLVVAEAVLWGLYGWQVSDPALVGYGLLTTAGATLILGRWLATRPRCGVAPLPQPRRARLRYLPPACGGGTKATRFFWTVSGRSQPHHVEAI